MVRERVRLFKGVFLVFDEWLYGSAMLLNNYSFLGKSCSAENVDLTGFQRFNPVPFFIAVESTTREKN